MAFTPSFRARRVSGTPMYDPLTRDYPLDAGGKTIDVHPVDQWVALLLGTLEGKIAGDPALGLKRPKRTGSEESKKLFQRAVTTCLAPPVNEGHVNLLEIEVTYPKRGQTHLLVKYENLLLSKEKRPRQASVTLGGALPPYRTGVVLYT